MTLFRRTSVAGMVGLLACAMLAAACGGSSTATTSKAPTKTSSSASSPSSTAAPVSASVTIGKAVDTIGFTTVDVALNKGYFKQEGVNAKYDLLNGSSTAFSALVSNSVQFVTASSTALMLARQKGLPLESIASLDYGVPLEMLVSNSWIAKKHLSTSESLKQRIQGMAGAKIGEISQTDKAFYALLFKDAGVPMSSVSIIHLSSATAELAAIQHGEIDAFMISPPTANFAQSQGNSTILATVKELPQTKDMAYDIVVVDTNYAQAHPAVVKAVATAFAKADNLIQTDPQAALPIEEKHFSKYSASVLSQSLHFVQFAKNGLQTQTMWNDAETVNVETGELKSKVPVTEGTAWTNQYIDTAALKS